MLLIDTKAKTYMDRAKADALAAQLNADDADMSYAVEQPDGAKWAHVVVTDRETGEVVGVL